MLIHHGQGSVKRVTGGRPLAAGRWLGAQKLLDRKADVIGDPPKQDGGDVAALVYRDGGAPAVRVAELLVRALWRASPKAMLAKQPDDFAGREDRNAAHVSSIDGD